MQTAANQQVGTAPQTTPATQSSLDTFTPYLDEQVPRLLERYGVPGVSVALIREEQVVWSGAYGYADQEQGHKLTVDAVFRVESISKSVTAWGIMRLVEQGLIDLDAPVQQYLESWTLPASAYAAEQVTIRRLLSQSAGLPLGPIGVEVEYPPQSVMPSLQEYLTAEAQLIHEPGARFFYSNVGFNLLELVIEEVTGRTFAAYMADEVLNPLGMHESSFAWNETMRPLLPMGYELQGDPVPPYLYPVHAAGGLLAPVEDIAAFVSTGMTGAYYADHGVLAEKSIRLMHTPEVDVFGVYGVVADAYGFGHFIETLPNGQQAVWHGGQGHGWMTHFHALPESGDGIVILTNSERSWPFMAQVLRAWSAWNGIGAVKMSRIIYATNALWVLIGLIVLASLWQVVRLLRGWRNGKRRLAPLAKNARAMRLLQAVVAITLIAGLLWSAAQPYLMVSAIFPATVGWAAGALLTMAVTLMASALLPGFVTESALNNEGRTE